MTPKTALASIPYANLLGVTVATSEQGVVLSMPFREELVGNARLPALHGGVVGAFLELTALVTLLAQSDTERIPKPINFSVDFLRSAGPHDTHARAEIVKHGRRIANVRVLAWQNDPDRPVAAGVGNFLLAHS